MATYTADQIADTIIHLSRERGIEITNLKLQKLLYYAQAWHLAFTGEPLFREEIEAWVHGPVVPSMFQKFRGYRWNTIDAPVDPVNDANVVGHINAVLDAYGKFSATRLEYLTHNERPWLEARRGAPNDEPLRNVISRETMQRYYSGIASASR
jgi:uncharacterized phage-associated protein